MNCNCLDQVKKSIIDTQPLQGKKITSVSFPTSLNKVGNKLFVALNVEATCTIEGKKANSKILLNYSFCPFCGKNSDPVEEKMEVQNDRTN